MGLSTFFSLITGYFFVFAHAVVTIEELSIGKSGKIHSVNGAIEYFHLIGVPNPPEVLSDKIILTPPTPGNSRGAIWSDKTLANAYWNVVIDFRATGPERAGGNIQIWYVKDGQQAVGTSSIYTVGKFDGLALTIDQYAGSGGSIRGFLNDGTTNYKSHHKVDSLSFGHCDYSYRNLGRPSRLTISQIDDGLHVSIDGKECFTSNKITLPTGYSLGITAAGAELPDSVEIFKVITSVDTVPAEKATKQHEPTQNSETTESKEPAKFIKDSEKSTTLTEDQSPDMNTRLQSVMKQLNKFQQALGSPQTQQIPKQDEIISKLRVIETKLDNVDLATKHILKIKKDLVQMKEDLHKSLEQHVKGLRGDVKDTQDSLTNTHLTIHDYLGDRMSLTTLVFLFWCGQAILLVGYVVYKRRRKDSAKKFL
ncbi:Protein ERGIC-53 [Erysiphe neolycopersici]|uniref:Protein ERGIC-53 n=1 Tax=Erysiphe neolycopersici TaxID=212602 RepID=A0A420HKD7_9PEZI|nr:Protein ERGIC-53 [Erysiphe neolycopersici]